MAILVALVFLVSAAEAHNGKVAFAHPLDGDGGAAIVIDGDPGDWPPDIPSNTLTHVDDGEPLDGADDLQATFRVAYSQAENALYISVSAQDNSVVRGNPREGGWDTQDGCEVYLEARHLYESVGPTQYQQWGERRGVYGPGDMSEFRSAVSWRDDGYDFEYRIDIDRATGGDLQLTPEMVLGFDVAIWERDADGSRSWVAWGRQQGKYLHSSRLGDLVIASPDDSMQDLLGVSGDVFEAQIERTLVEARQSVGYRMLFTGVLAAVTLLHVLLFLFDPTSRPNLYYALFTGAVAAAIFTGLQLEFEQGVDPLIIANLPTVAVDIIGLLGLRFLYSLFLDRVPRFFNMLVGCLAAFLTLLVISLNYEIFSPFRGLVPFVFGLLGYGVLVETLRLIIVAINRQREGAWIIGIGFSVFAFNISTLLEQETIAVSLLYWVLLPLASMSVYLARNIASTNRTLEQQLARVSELSIESQDANEALSASNEELRQTSGRLDESNQELREQAEMLRAANEEVMRASIAQSAFLANMSHEIRTPLNAIVSFSALIQQEKVGEIGPEMRDVVEEISSNGGQLLALIDDIMDLSKLEAGAMRLQLSECAPDVCLENAVRGVEYAATEKGLELVADVEEDVPTIQADERRLTQHVLLNLLRNSIKFTNEGTVRAGVRRHDPEQVLFWVADSGIGIPIGEQERIFESFHQVDASDTRAAEGTGLGLAIARHFVEMHGGRIWVDSESGKGATFSFTIPLGAGHTARDSDAHV
ncbi:MAG: ATP-binding protein [Candidatus Latescibacteria bacterium]|nr:ATP-binding protein [Candidatus Latescibacterota bacterium]MDP7447912.1 ATP-binding protein [Candidatus Latescibacterota bacterium]HJP31458.1 ATP-binding protein [Candidatus Latescibacterota bacterium]